MVLGFVGLGALAILLQVVTIVGLYAYLQRRSAPHTAAHPRLKQVLGVGVGLVASGQLAAIGAVSSLRITPLFDLQRAILVQNIGLVAMIVGYVLVVAGFVFNSRAGG